MPNIVYTVAEKIEMVRQHTRVLSYRHIVDHFAAAYPDRPIPSKTTVRTIVKKFNETGNVDPSLQKISQPSRQLTEELKLYICLAVEEDPKKTLAMIAEQFNISQSSVHKIVYSQRPALKRKFYKLRGDKQLPNDNNNSRIIPIPNSELNYLNLDRNLLDNRKILKTPNFVYTIAERVAMIQQREQGLSYNRIVDHFAAAYPHRPIPSERTVQNIVKRFSETGSLEPSLKKLSQPKRQLIQHADINTFVIAQEDLTKSTSIINQELDTSKSLVKIVSKAHKHLSYIHKVHQQHLLQDDKNHKVFSKNFMVRLNPDQDSLFQMQNLCKQEQ